MAHPDPLARLLLHRLADFVAGAGDWSRVALLALRRSVACDFSRVRIGRRSRRLHPATLKRARGPFSSFSTPTVRSISWGDVARVRRGAIHAQEQAATARS